MTEPTLPNDTQSALRILEAVLFASAEPLPLGLLQEQLGGDADVPALLSELQALYAGRGVNLVQTDDEGALCALCLPPSSSLLRRHRR